VCEADHSPSSSAEVKNGGTIPPLLHTSSWCGAYLIEHRDIFTFTLRPAMVLRSFMKERSRSTSFRLLHNFTVQNSASSIYLIYGEYIAMTPVLRFSLPILIPPTASYSLIILSSTLYIFSILKASINKQQVYNQRSPVTGTTTPVKKKNPVALVR
jgi:hypothetical protein